METKSYKVENLGGKRLKDGLASPASQKPDLRQEISAFKLLTWTYADERVRAASDGGELGPQVQSSTLLGRLMDGVEGTGRGTINGFMEIHDDALSVDALVWAWFDQNWSHRAYLASYLERRVAPPHPSTLEPERRTPRLRANGKPYVIYDRNRNAMGVLEDVVGFDAKQIEYATFHYALFVGLLDVLRGVKLKKWKVLGRGLTVYEESLTSLRTV